MLILRTPDEMGKISGNYSISKNVFCRHDMISGGFDTAGLLKYFVFLLISIISNYCVVLS